MASSRDRQRKLARVKLDRQMARRAASERRRRRVQAGVAAGIALVVIGVGAFWALGGFDHKPTSTAADTCDWTPVDTANNPNLKDVGKPPTKDLPTSGTRAMTVTTNQGGPVTVQLDLAAAPCAGASFNYLAGRTFFDNTKCHEITAEGALRCGDPSATGQGGPTYSFPSENVPEAPAPSPSATPTGQPPLYPAGTVAMVGNPPGSNGSQFLIFFKDFSPAQPTYPIVGKVTAGLDVVKKIGASETVDNGTGAKVKPKADVVIKSLTVGEPSTAQPAEPATPTAAPSVTPSASSSRS